MISFFCLLLYDATIRNNIYGKKTLLENKYYWGSVAGSVIQATETVEFEDGKWIGNYLWAKSLLEHPLPSFGKASIQANKKQTNDRI